MVDGEATSSGGGVEACEPVEMDDAEDKDEAGDEAEDEAEDEAGDTGETEGGGGDTALDGSSCARLLVSGVGAETPEILVFDVEVCA